MAARPLRVLTATTRETSELTGRLPDLLQSGALEQAAGEKLEAETSRLLLCGNPGFTKSVRTLLKSRGMTSPRFGNPGQILVEALW
ncbi:ferredoxin--NADP(+) reductase [gut metagenome]|uniref:Ferredoxin--NADP(+) reductase n=1 Tax=gut metagenome TaxID=749906 RepID=J9D299_9ZZZZ